MKREWLNPDGVAPPVAKYSHVATVEVGGGLLAFISGQVAMDDNVELVAPGDMAGQAEFCMRQIEGILRSLGGSFADVLKMTTFLTDMSQLAEVGEVRARFIADPPPASTAVEVSRLAREGLLIEIEAVAAIPARGSD